MPARTTTAKPKSPKRKAASKPADSVEERAAEIVGEQEDSSDERTSFEKRLERRNRIVYLRLSFPDWTWEDIAADEKVALSVRQCKQVYYDWAAADKEALRDEDPEEVIHDHLAGFRLLRRLAAELAANPLTSDAVVLGSLKLIADLRVRDIALRQETGYLPRELGRIRHEIDIRFLMAQVVEVLRRNKVPRGDIAQIVDALEDRERQGRELRAAG